VAAAAAVAVVVVEREGEQRCLRLRRWRASCEACLSASCDVRALLCLATSCPAFPSHRTAPVLTDWHSMRHGVVWRGMAWYVAWRGMWRGVVWHGMWRGVAWHGMAWYVAWRGVVWYAYVVCPWWCAQRCLRRLVLTRLIALRRRNSYRK
jgi:hypothetical protein